MQVIVMFASSFTCIKESIAVIESQLFKIADDIFILS